MKAEIQTIVSSYFYYMSNTWDEEECKKVFGNNYLHFWQKWCSFTTPTARGASERFYLSLTEHNRRPLVERANQIYCGDSSKIRNENLVCHWCASPDILAKAWVNPGLNDAFVKYCNENLDKEDDCYCNACNRYVEPVTQENLQHELLDWWDRQATTMLENISGLPPNSDGSTNHYDAYWNNLSFNERVKIRQDCSTPTGVSSFDRDEVLADIAYNAGAEHLADKYEIDSRALVKEMVSWADSFMKLHRYTDWEKNDYILTIDAFAEQKIKQFIKYLPSLD
ncbi:hypothetical protein [Bacteroides fragilis]|uniref:hypothetical protein n=1 Tax=Bacteroides fragilis TaxID=817 RepID=UPI0015FE6B0B|nr:hypothetical protein [Bacteroides fragilis]